MGQSTELSREIIIERVHQWGSSVVESILDPNCNIFSVPEVKGLIGYHTNRGCAVVFGDPVCALEERDDLVQAFHNFCEKQRKNVVYLVASEEFARWIQEKQSVALITFGEELYLDPQCDPKARTGKNGISLRGKLRHAEKSGVTVQEYHGTAPDLEHKIQDVASQWLQHRHGPQIYISRVRLFDERFGKRWFYAQQGDRIVGGIVLNRLQAKQGWVLDRIMTIPDAPQGTSEILVVSILEQLAQEGCRFLTFGATNGPDLGTISGFNKCTSFLAHNLYKASLKFFNLHRRSKYWEKFHPQSTPSFLVFKKPRLGFYEISGLLHALNVSLPHRF